MKTNNLWQRPAACSFTHGTKCNSWR